MAHRYECIGRKKQHIRSRKIITVDDDSFCKFTAALLDEMHRTSLALIGLYVLALVIGDMLLLLASSCAWTPEVTVQELDQALKDVFYLQYLAPDNCKVNLATSFDKAKEAKDVRSFIRCEKVAENEFARVDYNVNPYGHDAYNNYKTVEICSIIHLFIVALGLAIIFLPHKIFTLCYKGFLVFFIASHLAAMVMFAQDISWTQLKCEDMDEDVAGIQFSSTWTLPVYIGSTGLLGLFIFLYFFYMSASMRLVEWQKRLRTLEDRKKQLWGSRTHLQDKEIEIHSISVR